MAAATNIDTVEVNADNLILVDSAIFDSSKGDREKINILKPFSRNLLSLNNLEVTRGSREHKDKLLNIDEILRGTLEKKAVFKCDTRSFVKNDNLSLLTCLSSQLHLDLTNSTKHLVNPTGYEDYQYAPIQNALKIIINKPRCKVFKVNTSPSVTSLKSLFEVCKTDEKSGSKPIVTELKLFRTSNPHNPFYKVFENPALNDLFYGFVSSSDNFAIRTNLDSIKALDCSSPAFCMKIRPDSLVINNLSHSSISVCSRAPIDQYNDATFVTQSNRSFIYQSKANMAMQLNAALSIQPVSNTELVESERIKVMEAKVAAFKNLFIDAVRGVALESSVICTNFESRYVESSVARYAKSRALISQTKVIVVEGITEVSMESSCSSETGILTVDRKLLIPPRTAVVVSDFKLYCGSLSLELDVKDSNPIVKKILSTNRGLHYLFIYHDPNKPENSFVHILSDQLRILDDELREEDIGECHSQFRRSVYADLFGEIEQRERHREQDDETCSLIVNSETPHEEEKRNPNAIIVQRKPSLYGYLSKT